MSDDIPSSVLVESLFEESLDSIAVYSSNRQFIKGNPRFHDMHSIYGQLEDLFTDKETYHDFIEQLLRNGQIHEMEYEYFSAEHQKNIPCLINAVVIAQHDQSYFLLVIRDLTKRKQAEQKIIMAEKLSLTGNIARVIAHEVRNPLTNLNLAIGQLDDEIDSEEGKMYLEMISRNARRIGTLIDNLLNSSKTWKMDLKPLEAYRFLDDSLQLVADRLHLRDMRYDFMCTDQPLTINGDREKLLMAFTNLYVNAIEAMKSGKGYLRVKAEKDRDLIRIKVEDNGTGIQQADIKKLFDPFFSAKKKGTGLGLTTVQNIIHAHNGHIEVSSEPGVGTSFIIELPLV